ncbi:MAG: hypothetical protein ABL997_16050 [Planctomycetota bacterium]
MHSLDVEFLADGRLHGSSVDRCRQRALNDDSDGIRALFMLADRGYQSFLGAPFRQFDDVHLDADFGRGSALVADVHVASGIVADL